MCEFGVKVLVVSALLVAVLSEALPCGRHNSPINEVVATPDTTSSSPTTEVVTTSDTHSSSSPTTEVATAPDTTSSSPTTEVVTTPTTPSQCSNPRAVLNAKGVYLTPYLPYYVAMKCCYTYGLEPFIMRKGSKIDRQAFAIAAMESTYTWYPASDPQLNGTFIFADGRTVNDDNDAVFLSTRDDLSDYICLDIYFVALYGTGCHYEERGVCIDEEEFKVAYGDRYGDTYGDPEDYETIFQQYSQTIDEYFQMIGT